MSILTGNGQNLNKIPFKLENTGFIQTKINKANKKTTLNFIKGKFLTNQQRFQYAKYLQIFEGKFMLNITVGHAIVPS